MFAEAISGFPQMTNRRKFAFLKGTFFQRTQFRSIAMEKQIRKDKNFPTIHCEVSKQRNRPKSLKFVKERRSSVKRGGSDEEVPFGSFSGGRWAIGFARFSNFARVLLEGFGDARQR